MKYFGPLADMEGWRLLLADPDKHWKDEYSAKELAKVEHRIQNAHSALVPEGILSLGEISSYGDGYIEFFNKTIVVGVLYHAE